jgi:hypothetical protein
MAKQPSDEQKGSRPWSGEEVADAPGDEAERAAERAEGNSPVRADAEARRIRHEPIEAEPEDTVRRQPSGEPPDDKIAEAAEAHRERDQDERPPRGKI